MALLDKFGIGTSGALNKVLAVDDLDSPEAETALAKLLDNKKEAMEKTAERIQSGSRIQYPVLLKLIGLLLDDTTIDFVMQALPDFELSVQRDIATTLNTSREFDPHLLLPYLKEPLPLEVCRDMVMAHRREFQAVKLLKAISRTRPDLWGTIFELIQGNSSDSIFPEAMARTTSKDAILRKFATEVIADCGSPVAADALQVMLEDTDTEVRMAALRGLVRVKASLPAATIFQLMRQAEKGTAPLTKALLGYCKDPELMKYFNRAIFGKDTKLRQLVAEHLALVINEDGIRQVFLALADRPPETHRNTIQLLADNCGQQFIDAMAVLVRDPEKKIKDIVIKAIEINDHENPKIIDLMREYINSDIPAPIKMSFVSKLGMAKDTAAVPALIKILKSDKAKRVVTLTALERIADPSALADVFEMLAEDNADVQCAALACLSKIIPKKFASNIRTQLFKHANKLHEQAQTQLIGLIELITEQHQLPKTTAYDSSLGKLKTAISGQVELSIPDIEPSGSMEIPVGDNPFGVIGNPIDAHDGKPDTGGIATSGENSSPVEEGFAIELKANIVLANRYRLINEIGRGGYGSVWLVEDTFIKEQLVMKFLHQQLLSDEVAIERFIRELRIARKVTHTNIIRLFDYLDLGKVAAISMEYFPGAALSSIISQGAMESIRVVKLAKVISSALEAAHQVDVVHRDMKPANILVDENDTVKIVDFGIAAATKHAESRLTGAGTLIGTPAYISPEQIQGKAVDGRTDMYSLGIIMYEMLAGHPPYRAEDPMALVFMHVEGKARRLDEVNPVVPKELADIVHLCMVPNPEKRHQSMAKLAQALSQINLS